jgi:hypothetical protein
MILRVIEGLHEMIPLELTNVLQRDESTTFVVALALASGHLRCIVGRSVPLQRSE